MKILKIAQSIWKGVPKLEPIVEKVTTTAQQKTVIKNIVRVVQILAVCYLLYKGLIDSEEAIEVIKGK